MRYIKEENFAEAQRVLDYTTYPERLDRKQRNNYLFVKGFLARENNHFEEATDLLEEALKNGIKNEQYQAMALLALADMYMIRENKTSAGKCLEMMKGLKVNSSLIPSIRKMQEWVAL